MKIKGWKKEDGIKNNGLNPKSVNPFFLQFISRMLKIPDQQANSENKDSKHNKINSKENSAINKMFS